MCNFEDEILEQLNQTNTVCELLSAAMCSITQSINQLMVRIFRQDDYAVRYVINPLLHKNGPLNKLSVKLKLIYALGVIDRSEYEDIELISAILDELHQDNHCSFLDDEVLGPISLLHNMVIPAPPFDPPSPQASGILSIMQSSIQKNRYQQMVRSALIISITTLIVRLQNKKAFN